MIELLGTMIDKEVGEMIGYKSDVVKLQRDRLNIPPFKPTLSTYQWTDEQLALLGTTHDVLLAQQFGIHWKKVQSKRSSLRIAQFHQPFEWLPEHLALLGQTTDLKVAQKLGLSEHMVYKKRHSLGLASSLREFWTADKIALLGTMMDVDCAALLGVAKATILYRRKKHNIPKFQDPKKPPKTI